MSTVHIINQPHTETTTEIFSWCAYTQKARRLADMLYSLGREVITYGGETSDAAGELVTCISRAEQRAYFGEIGRFPNFVPSDPGFAAFNARVLEELQKRVEPEDIICHFCGFMGRPIMDALDTIKNVEAGIGYDDVYAPFRVYESYAWMHAVESAQGGITGATRAVGRFFDSVIPNYFHADEFPVGDGKGDYVCFVGRMIESKGMAVVLDLAEKIFALSGLRTLIAGKHMDRRYETRPGVEWVGPIEPKARAELMGGARCLLAPTLYLEPFGGVVVESQFCGTPAITTDWGGFTETVEQGVTGFRCRTMGEFIWAIEHAPSLSRQSIAEHARRTWSTDVIRHRYARYFDRLALIDGDGFATAKPRPPEGCEGFEEFDFLMRSLLRATA